MKPCMLLLVLLLALNGCSNLESRPSPAAWPPVHSQPTHESGHDAADAPDGADARLADPAPPAVVGAVPQPQLLMPPLDMVPWTATALGHLEPSAAWMAQAPSRVELLLWILVALLWRGASGRWQAHRLWQRMQGELRELQQEALPAPGRFHALLAHELRGPVAALSQQVEHLEALPLATREQLRVRRLQQGLSRVSRLLEQLLSLSRAQLKPEASARGGEHCSVQSVLRQVLEDLMPQLQQRQHHLALLSESDATVQVPAFDLHTLLRNLLENAIRYSPCGGHIEVSLVRRNHLVQIQVADSGPGIPQGDLERVFDPFYRLDHKATGTGLGLSIVQTMVRRAEGSVQLANRSGGGLVVTLTLPAQRPAG